MDIVTVSTKLHRKHLIMWETGLYNLNCYHSKDIPEGISIIPREESLKPFLTFALQFLEANFDEFYICHQTVLFSNSIFFFLTSL